MRDSPRSYSYKQTTKEDNGYITFADSATGSLPFISSSTDGISPGPLMMKVSAPPWGVQSRVCGEGKGLDVERIRNTDLFSQLAEKQPFKNKRGSPITFNLFLIGI